VNAAVLVNAAVVSVGELVIVMKKYCAITIEI
jgi:hypothetical protein